jgi:hypothetical protein
LRRNGLGEKAEEAEEGEQKAEEAEKGEQKARKAKRN